MGLVEFLNAHGSLHRRMKTWRSDESRKILFLLEKETIHLWTMDKTEGFGLRVVNGNEVARKIKVIFNKVCTDFSDPNYSSLVIRMSPFLLVHVGYLSLGIFYDLFQGIRDRR